MASGMGVALQRQFENAADGSRVLRQVFYARYIDWCKSDVIAPNRSSLTRCVQLQPSLLPFSCWVSGSARPSCRISSLTHTRHSLPVDLALLSGMPLITTAVLILADIAMILTGLFAALNSSSEKTRWLMYAVSCAVSRISPNLAYLPDAHIRLRQSLSSTSTFFSP